MCRVSLWPGNIPHCINLTVGETVFFPPEHALRAGFQAAAEGNKNHTPTDGITELREALSRKTYKDYWLKCNPESEIFARVGATEAVIAPLLAWLDPGEEVPIPNPRARCLRAQCTIGRRKAYSRAIAGSKQLVISTRCDVTHHEQVTRDCAELP